MGRNQNIYDFWFYITNFSRYPMEIYEGPIGTPLRQIFTFAIPILVVVNVPARIWRSRSKRKIGLSPALPSWSRSSAWSARAGCSKAPWAAIAARAVKIGT